jgi:hypothetical protein
MKAKSIKGYSTGEIKNALANCMNDGFKPTLAVVFISIAQDREAIRNLLSDSGIQVFGATTNGEFLDETLGKESVVIMLMDLDPSSFTILFADFPGKNYREVSQQLAQKAKQLFQHPAFLVAGSNMETDAEELLFGIEDVIGKQVNVFGGMAGDDYRFSDQFVFTNNKESDRGMVALVLDEDKIIIKGKATCGWKAVGTEKTVTKSIGNHVFTVDDIPVLDITAK